MQLLSFKSLLATAAALACAAVAAQEQVVKIGHSGPLSGPNTFAGRDNDNGVRLAIEVHTFPRVDKLTISIGYSRADPNLLPLEVLGRADRSLYQAKNDGRNRVYSYEELAAAGIFKDIDYGDLELF